MIDHTIDVSTTAAFCPSTIIFRFYLWRTPPFSTANIHDPYCPFKADVWYLGQMLHLDMDTEVKGFVEKVGFFLNNGSVVLMSFSM